MEMDFPPTTDTKLMQTLHDEIVEIFKAYGVRSSQLAHMVLLGVTAEMLRNAGKSDHHIIASTSPMLMTILRKFNEDAPTRPN